MIALDSFPRQPNHLLAALPGDALEPMLHGLEWVALKPGQVLHGAGEVPGHVHFPATATVSLVLTLQDGAACEVAAVGPEGMVGIEAFMQAGRCHVDAVVQAPGHGWRMGSQALNQNVEHSPPLRRLLSGYAQALMAHMAQTAACNRHHAVEKQLCRWLLAQVDRGAGHELRVTHEGIARMLGVRREGVTGAALKLQKAGVLHCGRGRIMVLDAAGLEARSCECHGAIRRAYGDWWGGRQAQPAGPAPDAVGRAPPRGKRARQPSALRGPA